MRKLTRVILLLSLWASAVWADPVPKPDPAMEYFAQVGKLASQGDVAAQACLGELYGTGLGVTTDVEKQFYWESIAANKGSDGGKLDVAKAYAWGGGAQKDPKRALALVQGLAAKGYLPAETTLGVLYVTGTGVAQDSDEAMRWFKKAALAGDFEGQVRLGLMYHWGSGVKADAAKAKMWLDKAAQHKSDCAAEFFFEMPFIINGYFQQNSINPKDVRGSIGVKFIYKDGRAQNVTLMKSSGNLQADNAWLQATRDAKLPPWPDSYHTDDKTMGFWVAGPDLQLDQQFVAGIRSAIQSAVLFPQEVLVGGSKGTGRATVEFDYLDGSASDGKITESSGEPSEDTAALAAIVDAKYPATPKEYAGQKLRLTIILNFQKVSPPDAGTHAVPAAVTHQ